MSSDKLIGPALPPMFARSNEEDSEDERESKYDGKFLIFEEMQLLFHTLGT